MADFLVTTADDIVDANDGVLSLREAVNAANTTQEDDTIFFADDLAGSSVRLTEAPLSIKSDIRIDGDLADDGPLRIRIDGISDYNMNSAELAGASLMFDVQGGTLHVEDITLGVGVNAINADSSEVSLVRSTVVQLERDEAGNIGYRRPEVITTSNSYLMISDSLITDFSGGNSTQIISAGDSSVSLVRSTIDGVRDDYATAIRADNSNVVIEDSNIVNVNSTSQASSFAIFHSSGELTINNSYIGNGDVAYGYAGAGILTGGQADIENTTISAVGYIDTNRIGAALTLRENAEVSLSSVTMSGTNQDSYGNANGILISPAASLSIANSIVDTQISGDFTSLGNNIFTKASTEGLTVNDQLEDDITSFFLDTISESSGRLLRGSAYNNGGLTRTIALTNEIENPALDAANAQLSPAADQRGFERIGAPDIGAFDLQDGSGTVDQGTIVTTADDIIAADGKLSLREAIRFANETADDEIITFADNLRGETISINLDAINVLDDLVIEGSGQELFTETSNSIFDGKESSLKISDILITSLRDNQSAINLEGGSLDLTGVGFIRSGINARELSGFSIDQLSMKDGGIYITNSFGNPQGDGSIISSTIEGGRGVTIREFDNLIVDGLEIRNTDSGLYANLSGTILVENSIITGNNENGLEAYGKAVIRNSQISQNTESGVILFDDALIEKSSITSNSYTGLRLFGSENSLSNTTIAGNGNDPGRNFARDGGLFAGYGKTSILNSTITGNTATSNSDVFTAGGGIQIDGDATVTLANSVVTGNTSIGANPIPSQISGNGSFESLGSNLLGTIDDATRLAASDRINATTEEIFAQTVTINSVTGGVATDNGGDTLTVALLADPNNPALNNANADLAPEIDQRGFERVGAPDIGAFELQEEVDSGSGDLNLVEGEAVDPDLINGVDPDILVGSGDTITIAFVSQVGAFNNSLGYYTYDEDGEIEDVGLVFAGDNDVGEGHVVDLDQIEAGEQFGLFLIQDGLSRNPELSTDGDFLFVERGGLGEASIFDETPADLIFRSEDGIFEIDGTILHALNIDGENPLNPRNGLSALSQEQDGSLLVAFEDKNPGSSSNDADFNDLVIRIDGLITSNFELIG